VIVRFACFFTRCAFGFFWSVCQVQSSPLPKAGEAFFASGAIVVFLNYPYKLSPSGRLVR
jgi:hypothetical protein